MQLIKEIIGVIIEHNFQLQERRSAFGNYYHEKVPEPSPYITLSLSDKKFTYGEKNFKAFEWERIQQEANVVPIKLWASNSRGTEETYYLFLFKGRFYLSEIDMEPNEVLLALKTIWQGKKDKLSRELDRIKARAEFENNVRVPIPEDVQILVWNRDGGKCVKCGGNENLEFDHIIPFSKGGSNSARNIQLLCERCNRSKGANVGG